MYHQQLRLQISAPALLALLFEYPEPEAVPGSFRQILYRLRKRQNSLLFHNKGVNIASPPAAETVIHLLVRLTEKLRRFFIMKRAESKVELPLRVSFTYPEITSTMSFLSRISSI